MPLGPLAPEGPDFPLFPLGPLIVFLVAVVGVRGNSGRKENGKAKKQFGPLLGSSGTPCIAQGIAVSALLWRRQRHGSEGKKSEAVESKELRAV